MNIQHITFSQLSQAYTKLKCTPLRINWVDIPGRQCSPTVAMVIALRKFPARKLEELFAGKPFEFCCKQIAITLKLHISYISGVELGFSQLSRAEISDLKLPEYLTTGEEFEAGYVDGRTFTVALD